ncbi:MAG: HAD family hydrolase, partial [Actinomycetota bacterium]
RAMGVVGFDLDMTLVDSADGIVSSVQYVLEGYGVQADGDDIRSTIGLPLDHVFPRWLPDEPYDVLLGAYRAHYREHGIPRTLPMPGASEAIDAVRAHGDRVLVVTAKYGAVAGLALEAAGLDVDEIVGDLFAEGKADALTQHGAWAYVGDHP